ncbi:hypothetical protein HK104_006709 [Borealophlyctis nickersoniae]|nr:hypothetical protein HK104_006709 [Borealophlyctis nickersoniae]
MADEDSGTIVEEAGTAAEEVGMTAEEHLRAESKPDVTTSTARAKPKETRVSKTQNPPKILARIPVFMKFVNPRFRKPRADGEDAAKAAEKNNDERSTYRASTNPKTEHPHLTNLHDDIFPLIACNAAPREAAKLCRLSRLHAKWKAIKTMLRARTVGDGIPSLPQLYKRLYKRFPGVPVDCAAKILEGLLVLGANINVEGSDAVLEDAIERGHEPVVRTLVEGGIKFHANNDQFLCQASKLGRYDMCDILIKSGADVNAQKGLPLLNAAEFGYTAVCKLLIEAGARLKEDENDCRLLRTAADKGQADVVRTLLDLGGDIFTNMYFAWALAVADCCGRKGARLRVIDGWGAGSIQVGVEHEGLAEKQDDCIVRILLANGAGRVNWIFRKVPKRDRAGNPIDPVHYHYLLTDCWRNGEHAKQLPFYEDQGDGEGTGHEN